MTAGPHGERDEAADGTRTLTRGILVGHGPAAFEAAAERLLTWRVHRDAGLRVDTTSPRAVLGATFSLTLGRGPLRVVAPCVVVGVLAEACDRGFTYEALPGHPERGVQHVRVTMDAEEVVRAVVHSESEPATLLARAGGPLTRLVQRRQVDRYLQAMRRAGAAGPDRAGGSTDGWS
jgi:uncharacterized protein (UPF0548 family)